MLARMSRRVESSSAGRHSAGNHYDLDDQEVPSDGAAPDRRHRTRANATRPAVHLMPRGPTRDATQRYARGRLAPLMLAAPPNTRAPSSSNSGSTSRTNGTAEPQPVRPQPGRAQQRASRHLGDENLGSVTVTQDHKAVIGARPLQGSAASPTRRRGRVAGHGTPARRVQRGRRSASQRPSNDMPSRAPRQSRRSALSRPTSPVRVPQQPSFLNNNRRRTNVAPQVATPDSSHLGHSSPPHVRCVRAELEPFYVLLG